MRMVVTANSLAHAASLQPGLCRGSTSWRYPRRTQRLILLESKGTSQANDLYAAWRVIRRTPLFAIVW